MGNGSDFAAVSSSLPSVHPDSVTAMLCCPTTATRQEQPLPAAAQTALLTGQRDGSGPRPELRLKDWTPSRRPTLRMEVSYLGLKVARGSSQPLLPIPRQALRSPLPPAPCIRPQSLTTSLTSPHIHRSLH